jgi:hypothetical protein
MPIAGPFMKYIPGFQSTAHVIDIHEELVISTKSRAYSGGRAKQYFLVNVSTVTDLYVNVKSIDGPRVYVFVVFVLRF